MQVRALVLALTATAMVQPVSVRAEDCAQLFIYAVNQVCRTLSNGFSQCEPVGLVGPAPQCVPPGVPSLMPMPLNAPMVRTLTPYPFLPPFPAQVAAVPQPAPMPTTLAAKPAMQAPVPDPVAAPAPAPVIAPAPVAVSTPAQPAVTPPTIAPADRKTVAASLPVAAASPAPTVVLTPAPRPEIVAAAPAGETQAVAGPTSTRPADAAQMPVKPASDPGPAPASAPPIVLAPAAAPMPSPAPAVRQETPALSASVAAPPPASPAAVQQASAPTTPTPVAAPQPMTLEDGLAHFDFDRAELSAQGRAELDAWLQQPLPKGTILRVTGHADRIGPAAYNLKLSGRRAETVKKYMVEKGVAAADVEVIAKGESEPVKHCKGGASKATIACLAPNRRVEIKP